MKVSQSGWVQVHGGKLVDLLRMQALAACGECGAGIRLVNLVRGARREANCTSCHAAVSGEVLKVRIRKKTGRMKECDFLMRKKDRLGGSCACACTHTS